ncbi:hypothetical protein [Burkholderia cepacia]|uniref:hypothetical protein n=1 Tax=Burkholderia cepacia TaxID=292 RepID=UPI001419F92D|nr:hypothetical protein [Burkholderia cepacia]
MRYEFRALIVNDLGVDVDRPKLAERSPTASRCRMPASNGLHPVESTTHNGRCCRAGLRYVWG